MGAASDSLIGDNNLVVGSKAVSDFDKNVEGDLEDVLNELNYDNEINVDDCCLQGGGDDSDSALATLM